MEVPNIEFGDASNPPVESLSKAELEEFQRVNVKTIDSLKNEIAHLKWKLNQYGPEAFPLQDYNLLLRQGGRNAISVLKDNLKKEIDRYASRLEETVRLTDVTVDAFDRNVQHLDDERCVKAFTLEVTVYTRRVRISCTVEEEFSTQADAPQEGKVTWFQIQFHGDIHNAIGEDIKRAAEKIALHSAFSLLKSYLNWKRERDEMIVDLSQSNPETLALFTSGDGHFCLKIRNPKPDRPVFTVDWGRKTVDGRVVPDLHLKVDAPEKWTAVDSEHVLESAPQIFETMITTLGLERALRAFVQLVATDGNITPFSQTPLVQEDGNGLEDGVS